MAQPYARAQTRATATAECGAGANVAYSPRSARGRRSARPGRRPCPRRPQGRRGSGLRLLVACAPALASLARLLGGGAARPRVVALVVRDGRDERDRVTCRHPVVERAR